MLYPHRPRAPRAALVAAVVAAVIAASGGAASAAPSLAPTPTVNGPVYAFTQIGTTLYIGGSFTKVGSVTVNGLAAVNTTTGAVVSTWKPITNGTVYALATDGVKVFAGGTFTTVNSVASSHIAAVGIDGHLTPAWSASASDVVRALAVANGRLYVGGAFTSMNGSSRVRLAALSTTDGSLVTTWRPRADSVVRALAVNDARTTVYAGGLFGRASATGSTTFVTRRNLAAFDSTSGALLSAWTPNLGIPVLDLDFENGRVYAAAAGSGGNLVAFDGVSQASGTKKWVWHTDGDVQAIAVVGTTIYAGGHWIKACPKSGTSLTACPSGTAMVSRPRLTSVTDGSSSASITTWAPNPTGTGAQVWALDALGGGLDVGGVFTRISGASRQNLARYKGI